MKPSRLRQACMIVFNLLALLCVLQNLWESEVPVVRYAWIPAAIGVLYVIVRGAKAFRLFLRSRDSDAACFIFLAAASFLSLFFDQGPLGRLTSIEWWGRAFGSLAGVLRFHDMFGNWWFVGLCALLGASLAAKVISKRAWRPARAGLSAARVGFVLVLVASVVWKAAGRRGWAYLSQGRRTGKVFEAESPDTLELPFSIQLDAVKPRARVTILTDDGRAARGELPINFGRWRICATELQLDGAWLCVVREPLWAVAAAGLVLVAVGLALDAAVGGRKGWT